MAVDKFRLKFKNGTKVVRISDGRIGHVDDGYKDSYREANKHTYQMVSWCNWGFDICGDSELRKYEGFELYRKWYPLNITRRYDEHSNSV